MLNNYPLGFYAPATLVKDAQRHGLHFKAIDINRSRYLFTIENEVAGKDANLHLSKVVRVGLRYVKGLRAATAEKIVAERENGLYTGIEDLVRRVPELRKNEIRALSLSGALNFGRTIHRRQALWGVELALQPKGDLFESFFRISLYDPGDKTNECFAACRN
jgi:error-prone DNA polymerase